MKRILGIGNALVDIMTLIDDENILNDFILPKGSMQLVENVKSEGVKHATERFPRSRTSGGSAANTIHGLAMLGADTGFIGSIGRDETGDFFEKDMKSAGVNTFLIRRNSPTGTAVALITPDSERTFATHLGAAVELTSQDLNPMLFEGYDILYLEGYLINDFKLIETACKIAKDYKMLIALDLASYNVVEQSLNNFRTILHNYVDILFANEQESKAFSGMDPDESLQFLSGFAETVILKIGPEGSWVKNKSELLRISAFPVKVVDTTGAGDLYSAGFLYGFAKGYPVEKCAMAGSMMAGKVIEIVGARMNREKFGEIKKEIKIIFGES